MSVLPTVSNDKSPCLYFWPDNGERASGTILTTVQEWRKVHADKAWLYNPWTGHARFSKDVAEDVYGLKLVPPDLVETGRVMRYEFNESPGCNYTATIDSLNQALVDLGSGKLTSITLTGVTAGLLVTTREWYALTLEEHNRLITKLSAYNAAVKAPLQFAIPYFDVSEAELASLNAVLRNAGTTPTSLALNGVLSGLAVVRADDKHEAAEKILGLMNDNSTLRQCIERTQVVLDDLNDTLQAAVAAPAGAG